MKIVIDISEKVYGLLKYFEKALGLNDKKGSNDDVKTALMRAVVNGTQLSEHHERLIEKINSKKIYKGRVFYSDMHDADMDKIHDIALDKAIETIQKDCETESEDR